MSGLDNPNMLALRDVQTLDKGPAPPYVLKLQEMFLATGEDFMSAAEVLCIPVLARQQGLLLALPSRALPQEALDRQEPIAPQAVLGPTKEVSVQAAIDDDGGLEMALDFEIPVMLVDFDAAVLVHMHGFDPVTEGESIQFFLEIWRFILAPKLCSIQPWHGWNKLRTTGLLFTLPRSSRPRTCPELPLLPKPERRQPLAQSV